MIFKKMWEISLSFCLNIPLYPQVLSVKVVNNTQTNAQWHFLSPQLKCVHKNRTSPERQALYIPHLYVKTFGGPSPSSCCREAATPPITAPDDWAPAAHPLPTGAFSLFLWPNLLHVFVTGHKTIAAHLRLLNQIKCFIGAGPIRTLNPGDGFQCS